MADSRGFDLHNPDERRWAEKLDTASNFMYHFLNETPPKNLTIRKEYDEMKKAWRAFNVAWFG